MKWYLVKSGKPNGEIYDHDVCWTRTEKLANEAYCLMESEDHNGNEFYWGGVTEMEGEPTEWNCVFWDGHQEVMASEYKGGGKW